MDAAHSVDMADQTTDADLTDADLMAADMVATVVHPAGSTTLDHVFD